MDIALKYDWYIAQAKKYDLVLKMVIIGLEGCFLFIAFSNLYLMIDIG